MKKFLAYITLAVMPIITFAANAATTTGNSGQAGENMNKFMGNLVNWVGYFAKFMFGLVVAGFFYGLVIFMFNEDKREDGKKFMLWGVVAMFIMGSIWGITTFIGSAIGVEKGQAVEVDNVIPKLK